MPSKDEERQTDSIYKLDEILERCDLGSFDSEEQKILYDAIERLFYSKTFRIGNAELPQEKVRSRLYELDGSILRSALANLHKNDRQIKNLTGFLMSTIFNCITCLLYTSGRAASKTLPLGLYTVRETQAPAYYSINETVMTANLEFSGQIVTFEVLDKSVSTGVSIIKRGYNEVMPNNPLVYTFTNIANTSSVPLESFYWREMCIRDR